MVRFVNTSEGYLAMPIDMLGTEYYVASYPDPYGDGTEEEWQLNSFTACVGTQSNTSVEFTMGGTDISQTASGLSPGESDEFEIGPCDVVVVGGKGFHADSTGSKWKADKAIAVVSGNFCPFIPSDVRACDHTVEMELPINSWSTYHYVTPIWGRTKPSILRVFAREKNTMIYCDGVEVALLTGQSGLQDEGWLEMRASDISEPPRPVLISGSAPISVQQYNTGIMDDNAMDTDPFQMLVLPYDKFGTKLTFHTPGIRGGFGFDNNFINLIYEADESGNIPDDIVFIEKSDYLISSLIFTETRSTYIMKSWLQKRQYF